VNDDLVSRTYNARPSRRVFDERGGRSRASVYAEIVTSENRLQCALGRLLDFSPAEIPQKTCSSVPRSIKGGQVCVWRGATMIRVERRFSPMTCIVF